MLDCLRGFTIDCWWVLVMVLDCDAGCLCWLIRFGLMLVCCFSCVWFGGGFGVLLMVAASWVGVCVSLLVDLDVDCVLV